MDARPRRLVSARSAALPGLHQFRLAETVSALVEETNRRISLKRAFGILQSDPRVHAKTKAGPHPDPLPSDGNSQVCLSHFPTRLDTPTDRRRFSLSHPPCRASDARLAPELHVAAGRMGEGRGGKRSPKIRSCSCMSRKRIPSRESRDGIGSRPVGRLSKSSSLNWHNRDIGVLD